MANGFISSEGRLAAEDVGDSVWNELSSRSFFEDIERDECGKVISFKMHDLVRDLARSVANDVCCITHDDNEVIAFLETIHHLSDHWRKPHSIQLHQVKSLRTYVDSTIEQVSPDVFKCYSLRVLEVIRTEKLSSSIGDLKHLRYLNLSYGKFETLTESICKLWNLQILKLDNCYKLQKLPNSLIRLKALQQLSLKNCHELSSLPAHIGQLTSLRILSKYIVGEERGFTLEELGPLKLKGGLHMEHLEKVKSVEEAKEANMSNKQLNELKLTWRTFGESELQENVEEILDVLQPYVKQLYSLTVVGYKGVNFPKWMSSSPSLTSLTLVDMPNLEKLSREDWENMFPRLSRLHIYNCPKFLAEEVLVNGLHSLKTFTISGSDKLNVSAGFQCLDCLEDLSIEGCREMEGLDGALHRMTSLQMLTLVDLPNLESLPDCFGDLPLLRHLIIWQCDKLRCLPTSLREPSANFEY